MEEYTNRELGLRLDSIIEKVDNGFSGVHERQDKTNGKVGKHDDRLDDIEKKQNRFIGGAILANIILVPVIVGVVVRFLINN